MFYLSSEFNTCDINQGTKQKHNPYKLIYFDPYSPLNHLCHYNVSLASQTHGFKYNLRVQVQVDTFNLGAHVFGRYEQKCY